MSSSHPGNVFTRALSKSPSAKDRRWIYVPYDQLSDAIGPLSREKTSTIGIVLVESTAKAARRPYHKQKLALVLANMRHFAVEQIARGVAVKYIVTDATYAEALAPLAKELGAMRVMEPSERELRVELAPLVAAQKLIVVPHEGRLTTLQQFTSFAGAKPPWRMDRFYRGARKATGILMDERGSPIGGKLSFDAENRKPWKGEPPAPTAPTFEPDAITREVGALIESRFANHPGRLDLSAIPATKADAERSWKWALEHCLPHFGPFEDALSTRSRSLFHTRISALMNLHRVLPKSAIDDVLASGIPLQSREGFVRQILGWREFVFHVHYATDGFRTIDADARPSSLNAHEPLPPAWWGKPSGLACLDHAVHDVWDEAYSHHIVRLMVLSNIATLLGVEPRELTDWFWVAYSDAYDWVVEPNVLGMGTYAVGDLMTTKPYVCGAAYIHKMSDYCTGCRFDPRTNCPITPMYWNFLSRNALRLAQNQRMSMPVRASAKRTSSQNEHAANIADRVLEILSRGDEVTPESLA